MNDVVRHEPKRQELQRAVTPMDMLQMAVQQGADLDKLSKLMDLQERWEANEARKAFTAAMTAFKSDPPKLTKNKHVKFESQKGVTEYDHASLDHVVDEIGAALSRHGISHTWETDQLDGGMIRVTCVLTHEAGHSTRTPLQASADQSGGKNNIQGIGSAVTYLQRYTLLSATGMAVKGQDDDGRSSEAQPKISTDQVTEINDLIQEASVDRNAFLAWAKRDLKAGRVEDLNQKGYETAKGRLNDKIAANRKAKGAQQ